MSEVNTPIELLPEPLPYLHAVSELLKVQESNAWDLFLSSEIVEEDCESIRLDLLKNAYRMSSEYDSVFYALAQQAAEALGIDPRITLYHGGSSESNAMILYIPGEAHIVFSGDVLKVLSKDELLGVMAHELGHYKLYQIEEGAFYTAQRMLSAAAATGDPAYAISDSRFRRASEIYADRCALAVCGDFRPVITGLVKVHTSLEQVDAEGYLQQAEEVLNKIESGEEYRDHPETYIRAKALALWQNKDAGCDTQINTMLEGKRALTNLDIVGRAELAELTQRFVSALLEPSWFQTEAVLGQAKLMFEDFEAGMEQMHTVSLHIPWDEESLKNYFYYLMLDFALVDAQLEETPMAWVLSVADRVDLLEDFEKVARKELKTTKKEMMRIFESAPKLMNKAQSQDAGGES